MNCDKVKELLWAYLENKTTAEETAEIETHLEGCAACREELAQQKEIKNALASLPDEELLSYRADAEAAGGTQDCAFPCKEEAWLEADEHDRGGGACGCGGRRHEGDAGNAAEPERGDRADSV